MACDLTSCYAVSGKLKVLYNTIAEDNTGDLGLTDIAHELLRILCFVSASVRKPESFH